MKKLATGLLVMCASLLAYYVGLKPLVGQARKTPGVARARSARRLPMFAGMVLSRK